MRAPCTLHTISPTLMDLYFIKTSVLVPKHGKSHLQLFKGATDWSQKVLMAVDEYLLKKREYTAVEMFTKIAKRNERILAMEKQEEQMSVISGTQIKHDLMREKNKWTRGKQRHWDNSVIPQGTKYTGQDVPRAESDLASKVCAYSSQRYRKGKQDDVYIF